jgi:alpha-L-rhamnosidase
VVTKTTYPSWGYWIVNGATTLWEAWNAESSHNHQMFGTVNEYFYKYLAGIQAPTNDGTSVAYGEIHIKPYIPEDMEWAEASLETVRGNIFSRWEKSGEILRMEITIPANTSGKITIPKINWRKVQISENGGVIWQNGQLVESKAGIITGTEDDRSVVLEVQSGKYEFEITES